MGLETFLLWLLVGLVAGWLASLIVPGPFGVIGDIVVGIVGAFVGSFIFRSLDIGVPFGGLPGRILVAFVGAVILLLILRLFRRATVRS